MAQYSKPPQDPRVERALDNPTRRAILDALVGEQALGPRSISEKLGISAANASYHVGVLAACGAVEAAPDEKRRGERLVRLSRSPAEEKSRLDASGSMRDDVSADQLKGLIESASQLRPGHTPGT